MMKELAFVILWIGSLALFQRGLNRLVAGGRLTHFAGRKVAHVAVGLWIVPLALFVHRWSLAAIPVVMILAGNTQANLSRARLGRAQARLFPLVTCAAPAALILYFWKRGWTDVVLAAILTMTFGDTAAALFGRKFGRHKVPWTGKTIEGAVANFVTSLATLLAVTPWLGHFSWGILAVASAAASVVEAALPGEWDNPVAVMLLMGVLAAGR
jgi:dolichol kinase